MPMGPDPRVMPSGVRTVPGTPVHVTGGSSRSMISRTPSNGGPRTPMTPGTPGGRSRGSLGKNDVKSTDMLSALKLQNVNKQQNFIDVL